MAIARYTFPIRSKIKVGRMAKFPCVVGWFDSDILAELARVYIQSLMANYASVGLSKSLVLANEGELEDPPTVHDILDLSLRLGKSIDSSVNQQIVIPGCDTDINPTLFLALDWRDPAGNALNIIRDQNNHKVNVIAGDKI